MGARRVKGAGSGIKKRKRCARRARAADLSNQLRASYCPKAKAD
jgi:hypothetical protein